MEKQVDTPRWPQRIAGHVRKRWRAWLRALHRDAGYLAVGLTLIYALSGLAINHIKDWDPNFKNVDHTYQVPGPYPEDEQEAGAKVLAAIGSTAQPADVYYATENQLEIEFDDKRVIHVDTATGQVVEQTEKPRFFLRVANWLHYNRGKAAWTYIADGYAVFLLFLAVSGIFMIKGRRGLIGRGALLIALGAAVPILYVHFSGGPGG
ncbi:MAG TPA: PepSY-associated TM helix domain-containing protein [Kofleriaceae bacterium]|nr:PepSY-associated TM helix domain-containing protein [Kofleriaceae bacterium]